MDNDKLNVDSSEQPDRLEVIYNDPEHTYFNEVYQAFLGMIDSYELASISDDELMSVLWGFLDTGRNRLYAYISKDFYDVDNEHDRFNFKCTHAEIGLLAKCMKLEWVSTVKHSEELMRKSIGDRDYKAQQGYQYLEKLQAMENQLKTDIKNTMNEMEYSDVDLWGTMA